MADILTQARNQSFPQNPNLTPTQSKVSSLTVNGARKLTDPYFVVSAVIGAGAFAGTGALGFKFERVTAMGFRENNWISSTLKIASPFLGASVNEITYRGALTLAGKGFQYPGLWNWDGENGLGWGLLRANLTDAPSYLFGILGGGFGVVLMGRPVNGRSYISGMVGCVLAFGLAHEATNSIYDSIREAFTEPKTSPPKDERTEEKEVPSRTIDIKYDLNRTKGVNKTPPQNLKPGPLDKIEILKRKFILAPK